MDKLKFFKKEKIEKLPKKPGVYIFKKGKEFLYIGKAANIKERVKNHFLQPTYRDNLFINQVSKIDYFKTNSEIEALILEANLIKKYRPKYNIVWRDDKNYFFVGITNENFPRVFITHQPQLKTKCIGPFIDGKALKQTLKILRKVFPYRGCKTLPRRPCLWYQLGRCPAPCLLRSALAKQIPSAPSRIKDECKRNAKNLIKILRGKKKQTLNDLKKEMKAASALQDFEKAAKIRDQISAFEKIIANAKIFEPFLPKKTKTDWFKTQKILQKIFKTEKEISRIEAYDVSNIQGKLATGAMATFIDGEPNKNFYRKFKIRISGKPNDIAMLKEILARRLQHLEWLYPDLVLIDGGKAQLNVAQLTINNQRLTIPVIALAKKKNELYVEGRKKPVLLKNLPREIFNLILQLRDEAHRFAISYHKQLRKEGLLGK